MEEEQIQLIEKSIIVKLNKIRELFEKKMIKMALYKGDQCILMSGYGLIGLIPYTITYGIEKFSDYITFTIDSDFSYNYLLVDEWYKVIIDTEEEEIPDGYIYFKINDISIYIPIIKDVEHLNLPDEFLYEEYIINPVDKEKRETKMEEEKSEEEVVDNYELLRKKCNKRTDLEVIETRQITILSTYKPHGLKLPTNTLTGRALSIFNVEQWKKINKKEIDEILKRTTYNEE